MENEKDENLWRTALKRAAFKRHLYTYLIINAFLWSLWIISTKEQNTEGFSAPWPIWPTLGWGIGVFFNYRDAYNDVTRLAEKEYKKLKDKQNV